MNIDPETLKRIEEVIKETPIVIEPESIEEIDEERFEKEAVSPKTRIP